MSATERRALLLLLALGLVGQGVRWLLLRPGEPPGQVELLAVLPPKSPTAHRDSIAALARPLAPGELIDADRAGPGELARLPRVGPGLAKRIVAHREANGPFGGIQALDRVPGIGPALLEAIRRHVTFSMAGHAAGQPAAQIAAGPALTGCPADGRRPACLTSPLDLNLASVAALDSLPGIGPTRAASIVQYRASHGPFRSVEELGRVSGMGPAALARIRDLVTVP
jgi:competence ComEA-like helix-hairpin-helix protein